MRGRLPLIAGGALIAVAVVAAVAVLAASSRGADEQQKIVQASPAQLAAAGLGDLPFAPTDRRVDLELPSFSHPTEITNPLFPISELHSAILSGHVEGKPFKTETTLLPVTRYIEWPEGRPVEVLISQYVAYLGGQLEEVALDFYAQADDGAVWYFGEDVFNYEDGAIADREGTWLAGRDGPAAMIMPAHPRVGDAYRSENTPGFVFEEVTISAVDRTVRGGPRGPVSGALIAHELHQDGEVEDKTFAPGYGEFFTGGGGDVEAMSLAVPVDAAGSSPPPALEALRGAAGALLPNARGGQWDAAMLRAKQIENAWQELRSGNLAPRLAARLGASVSQLSRSVRGRAAVVVARSAIDVSQATLDLELRYRPPAEIDRARFGLWARRLEVDAAADDESAVKADCSTLEWIRDRFARRLAPIDRTQLDATLLRLRGQVRDGELDAAGATAARLVELVQT